MKYSRQLFSRCILFCCAGAVASIIACGPILENHAAFTGHWEQTVENGITGKIDKESWDVQADGDKFHIVDQKGGGEIRAAFDGQELRTGGSRLITLPDALNQLGIPALSQAAAPPPMTPEEKKLAAGTRRFWLDVKSGHSSAGEPICGRETVLYESSSHHPEGDTHLQIWFDKETGIVLRRVSSIYSSQIQSMVTKTTLECTSVDFTPPPPSVFSQL